MQNNEEARSLQIQANEMTNDPRRLKAGLLKALRIAQYRDYFIKLALEYLTAEQVDAITEALKDEPYEYLKGTPIDPYKK